MSDRRQAGQGGHMGCLLAVFAGMFPRFALIIFWIARPERMDATFTTFLWPLLGIIFLPFTTLIYVLLWSPGHGRHRLRLAVDCPGRAPRPRPLERVGEPAERRAPAQRPLTTSRSVTTHR